ncbi:MAG: hypothetical protein HYV07_17545 [Deltaproteobacteria bacterium]|nr:hypothetical protein [Deltaproteobacteria bacterium]
MRIKLLALGGALAAAFALRPRTPPSAPPAVPAAAETPRDRPVSLERTCATCLFGGRPLAWWQQELDQVRNDPRRLELLQKRAEMNHLAIGAGGLVKPTEAFFQLLDRRTKGESR